ncbi:hypothetical protein ACXYMU_07465 [Pontibacter sp. CAU 1760]
MEEGIHFSLNAEKAKWMLFGLFAFELLLTLFFVASAVFPIPENINRLFDLDGEGTIPAWFSAIQLFTVGLVFLSSSQWTKISLITNSWFLNLAGLGFIFLSMDESAGIHERITGLLEDEHWAPKFEGEYGTWIYVYALIAVMLVGLGIRTILSFFKAYPTQSLILALGMTMFLAGGVGLEIISYWYLRGTESVLYYKIEVALEELLEMAGITVVLFGGIHCALTKIKVGLLADDILKSTHVNDNLNLLKKE